MRGNGFRPHLGAKAGGPPGLQVQAKGPSAGDAEGLPFFQEELEPEIELLQFGSRLLLAA
jgi:hypothetical protein